MWKCVTDYPAPVPVRLDEIQSPPAIELGRPVDEDDATFVQLAEYKVTCGKSVMQLRRNSMELHADLIARAGQVLAELGKLQQEQINRRATILSSIIRILP
jgi:hypothetical protein